MAVRPPSLAVNGASVILRVCWNLLHAAVSLVPPRSLMMRGRNTKAIVTLALGLGSAGCNSLVQIMAARKLHNTRGFSPTILAELEDAKIISCLCQYTVSFLVYAMAAPSVLLSPSLAMLLVGIPSAFVDQIQVRNALKLHTLGLLCFGFMEGHRYMISRSKGEGLVGLVPETLMGVLSTWLLPIAISVFLEWRGRSRRVEAVTHPSSQDVLMLFRRPSLEAAFEEDFGKSQVEVDQAFRMTVLLGSSLWLRKQDLRSECAVAVLLFAAFNVSACWSAHHHRQFYLKWRHFMCVLSPILTKLTMLVVSTHPVCGKLTSCQSTQASIKDILFSAGFMGTIMSTLGLKLLMSQQILVGIFNFVLTTSVADITCEAAGWTGRLGHCVLLFKIFQFCTQFCLPICISFYLERHARAKFLQRMPVT